MIYYSYMNCMHVYDLLKFVFRSINRYVLNDMFSFESSVRMTKLFFLSFFSILVFSSFYLFFILLFRSFFLLFSYILFFSIRSCRKLKFLPCSWVRSGYSQGLRILPPNLISQFLVVFEMQKLKFKKIQNVEDHILV